MTTIIILRGIWNFIKRHWIATLIVVALLSLLTFAGAKLWQARAQAQDYVRQLQSFEAVTEIHEGAYLQQTARLDLAETLIRQYNPAPRTEVAYQVKTQIVYRTRTVTVEIPATGEIPDTDGGGITLTGRVECPVLNEPGRLELTYTVKPLDLDLFITRGPDGEYATIIDTHDPNITIATMKTRLDPAVFRDEKHWFAGAGVLTRLRDFRTSDYDANDIGGMVQVGFTTSSWFVAGQAQYLDGFGVGLLAGGRF